MQFVPVVSSALLAVKFDRETNRLVVQFGEDIFYVYNGVPGDVVLDFLFADSIGRSFDVLVKKGGFGFKRISVDEAAID